jgi:hypothetical protein
MLETLLRKIEESEGEGSKPQRKPRKPDTDMQGVLSSLADKVGDKKKLLGSALAFASPQSLTEDQFVIVFDRNHRFQMESILSRDAKGMIEAELATILGRKVTLSGVLREEREQPRQPRKAKKKPEENETVKQVMETFDAEIVDVEEPGT